MILSGQTSLEHAPLPIATLEGAMHIVRYANPAFCQLIDKSKEELLGHPFLNVMPGKGECLALIERVYRTEQAESYTEQEHADPQSLVWFCTAWPVIENNQPVAVVIQVVETVPLYAKVREMNEALILGSLRQHELNAVANTEIAERKQREIDAQMLTSEISHRIKNNLQIIVALIGHESKRAPAPCVEGYEAIQRHIAAIGKLYDLISQSSRGQIIPLDTYLHEIANTLSASLLSKTSGIKIEVEAEALDIDPNRAVPFGLLVNELATNAIKHAFPDGTGSVLLSVRHVGDEIELDVADTGVGMENKIAGRTAAKHGTDFVAIFVRQLGGMLVVLQPDGAGTIVRIRMPIHPSEL